MDGARILGEVDLCFMRASSFCVILDVWYLGTGSQSMPRDGALLMACWSSGETSGNKDLASSALNSSIWRAARTAGWNKATWPIRSWSFWRFFQCTWKWSKIACNWDSPRA